MYIISIQHFDAVLWVTSACKNPVPITCKGSVSERVGEDNQESTDRCRFISVAAKWLDGSRCHLVRMLASAQVVAIEFCPSVRQVYCDKTNKSTFSTHQKRFIPQGWSYTQAILIAHLGDVSPCLPEASTTLTFPLNCGFQAAH